VVGGRSRKAASKNLLTAANAEEFMGRNREDRQSGENALMQPGLNKHSWTFGVPWLPLRIVLSL